MTKTTPVAPLIPDAAEFRLHVERACNDALQSPGEVHRVLAAVIFLHQLKDWVPGKKGDTLFRTNCPYAQTIAEISNGTKHMELTTAGMTTDPHVTGIGVMSDGAGSMPGASVVGGGPVGSAPGTLIVVRTRRAAADGEKLVVLSDIIREALAWWKAQAV